MSNQFAVYVFRDQACMHYGFTLQSFYCKTQQEAERIAEGWKFHRIVKWQ